MPFVVDDFIVAAIALEAASVIYFAAAGQVGNIRAKEFCNAAFPAVLGKAQKFETSQGRTLQTPPSSAVDMSVSHLPGTTSCTASFHQAGKDGRKTYISYDLQGLPSHHTLAGDVVFRRPTKVDQLEVFNSTLHFGRFASFKDMTYLSNSFTVNMTPPAPTLAPR